MVSGVYSDRLAEVLAALVLEHAEAILVQRERQIEIAVSIEVAKRQAVSAARIVDAGARGDVGEGRGSGRGSERQRQDQGQEQTNTWQQRGPC